MAKYDVKNGDHYQEEEQQQEKHIHKYVLQTHKIQKNNEQEEQTDPLLKQPEEYCGDDGRVGETQGHANQEDTPIEK